MSVGCVTGADVNEMGLPDPIHDPRIRRQPVAVFDGKESAIGTATVYDRDAVVFHGFLNSPWAR